MRKKNIKNNLFFKDRKIHNDIIKFPFNVSGNYIININFHICDQCYFSCELFLIK